MCGVVALRDLQGTREVDPELLARMTRTLVHRGPDGEGFHRAPGVGLGFRHLAIVDPAGGHQPKVSETGDVALVCNGEIYNHDALRRELQARGHRFRSRNDVEVILPLYLEHGVGCVDRLDGQFALVLWDGRRRRLLLARDPFGVCPLHYAVTATGWLVVASEVKALLEHPDVPRGVDLRGLDQVLCFPGLVSPTTFFAGVSSLPPGHLATVEDGQVDVRSYWDLDYPLAGDGPAPQPEAWYRERLAERFEAAVAKRLQGDVPVGLYLSGGLDSSLIGAVAHRLSGPPSLTQPGRNAFSTVFDDPAMDERSHQRIAAEHIGARHHLVPFSWEETPALLERVLYHCECPIKESYNTCSMALAGAARGQRVPVILSGDGADELFAGYVGYRFDGAARPGQGGFDPDEAFEAELRERLWGDADLFYEQSHYAFREVRGALYSADVAGRLDEFDCLEGPLVDTGRLRGRHPLHQRSYLDFKLRLADHLLSDHGDRMTMSHSVEGRYPFLDRELVEFVASIPPELKLSGLNEKYLLKEMARAYVPDAIVRREKFGFHAPGSPYLLRTFPEWMQDALSEDRIRRQGYFSPTFVARLKQRYREPDFRLQLPYETDLLFTVLSFSMLVDRFDLPVLS